MIIDKIKNIKLIIILKFQGILVMLIFLLFKVNFGIYSCPEKHFHKGIPKISPEILWIKTNVEHN